MTGGTIHRVKRRERSRGHVRCRDTPGIGGRQKVFFMPATVVDGSTPHDAALQRGKFGRPVVGVIRRYATYEELECREPLRSIQRD